MKKLYVFLLAAIGILMPGKLWAQDKAYKPYFDFEGDNLAMHTDTEGAIIYYEMSVFAADANEDELYDIVDRMVVGQNSSIYTAPIPIKENVIIKAIATGQGLSNSDPTILIYNYTTWQMLLDAIEYGNNVFERAQNYPDINPQMLDELMWAIEEGQHMYRERGQMPDSHEAEHFTERIVSIAREIEGMMGQPGQPEPYAVLSDSNTVLTFYYDNLKQQRNGMGVGPFSITSYDDQYGTRINSGWDEYRENITSVVFDPSFANYTTLNSTAYWFYYMQNLKSITGIANLNTDNVTDMSCMFDWCSGLTNLDVTGFKTDNVTDMSSMFEWCSGLTNLDVTGFKTDKVTNMVGMFYGCSGLTSLDVSGFNTANVTNMGGMFSFCSALTSIDVSNFNTVNVTDMDFMFYICSGLMSLDVTGFKTDKVTNMVGMFQGCTRLTTLDVTGFKTDNVMYMGSNYGNGMFQDCTNLKSLDLSGFKTDNMIYMNGMFSGCSSLTTIYAGDGWSTAKVQNGQDMFTGCTSLVGGAGTVYDANHTDHTYAHIDGGTANPGYFTDKNAPANAEPYAVLSDNNTVLTFYYDNLKQQRNGMGVGPFEMVDNAVNSGWYEQRRNITNVIFDTSFANCTTITSTAYWFYECSNLTSISGISNLKTDEVTYMIWMFYNCSSLTEIDVSGFNTSKVTNMARLFSGCSRIRNLNVSNFKTDKVDIMNYMFHNCSSLSSIDVSGFNTATVKYMDSMFYGCSNLTSLDVSGFNTENVLTMYNMFAGCNSLTNLDVSGFKTDNVTTMFGMFHGCINLTDIDVSGFKTNNVTNMTNMFAECYSLTSLDLSEFNTEKVTGMSSMFWDCHSLTNLDVSGFRTDNVTDMFGMFRDCFSLINLNISNFNTSNVTRIENYLYNCSSLASIQAGSANIPAEEYARIGNPNLLVYVNEASLVPQGIQNVVINGQAKEIILTDVTEGNNNWHCPEPFTAERIRYTRNFRQQTQVGISRGWESIALPFNVQTITHETQGQIIPFAAQGNGKRFWLRGYSENGLYSAPAIEANRPYVISMPNNTVVYPNEYNLNGRVTFAASNTTVPATPNAADMTITRGNISMTANFLLTAQSDSVYAINVGQARGNYAEGSVFARGLRDVRPFEAYTIHTDVNGVRPNYIRIAPQGRDNSTGIETIESDTAEGSWYSLDGRKMQSEPKSKGIYIQNGKKVVVR